MEYPYIELAKQCIERLRSMEIEYPSNLHEWRHHEGLVGNSLDLCTRYSPDKYYHMIVKYTDQANLYLEEWLKCNVMTKQ
jgi:hypothetical protein